MDEVERTRTAPSVGLAERIASWTRATTVSFALVALTLVVLLVVVDRVFGPRVREAVDASQIIGLTNEAMLDQEASLRAFLLSNDETFISPFRRARNELQNLNEQARELVGRDPTTNVLFVALVERETAWIDGWAPDALTAGRRQAGARGVDVLLIEGKALFDAYRDANLALITELAARRDDALDDEARAIQVTAGLALLATVLMAVGSVHRSRQLRASIDPPLGSIQAHLARIAAGDFAAWPALDGPAELQQIGTGINATSRALAAAHAREVEQVEQTRTQNRQLGQVLRVAREIAGSLNLRYVVRGVCTAASTIADGRRVVIWLRSDDDSAVVASADSAGPDLEPVGLEPIALGEGPVGRAAHYGRLGGQSEGLLAAEAEARTGDGPGRAGTSVAMPMVVGAEVIGVLEVVAPDARELAIGTLNVLEALAVQAASAVASARVHEETKVLAMTDALTHLPNRRRLEGDLDREVGVSTRYGRPLGFAMLDVDHFKAYNDTLGHQAADEALQALARLLSDSVRAGDTVYRYGGEEIALVMRETTLAAAYDHAERLRLAVVHHFAGPRAPRALTVSIGVAAMPESAASAATLVAAADAALYEAKRHGRDRVCLATTSPPDTLPSDG